MSMPYLIRGVLITGLFVPLLASAQSRPDPLDPTLESAVQPRTSAFKNYQRFEEDKPLPWREANDRMKDLGGHAGHVKGDSPAAPSGSPQSPGGQPRSTAPRPPAGGHSQHRH